MSQGWIQLHRGLVKKPIWLNSTPEQKTVLIALLLMANHTENKWEWRGRPYVCKPGQFVTSLEGIKDCCGEGVSMQNVRTALKRFLKLEFLTNESTKQNRLITICNWETYQTPPDEANKRTNRQLTNASQSTNRQVTTNNNYNNGNNGNNGNKSLVFGRKNSFQETIIDADEPPRFKRTPSHN